ncbi:hypothetical protein HDU79_010013, partial [Rhizoclosmatium sp. JEL0117]
MKCTLRIRLHRFSTQIPPKSLETPTHVLRDYQRECIDTSLRRLKEGVRRQAVSLPVGSGKTVIFANLIKALQTPETCPTATKALVLAHRTELLSQAAAQIRRVMPDCKILLEQGRKMPTVKEINECDIVVASVPTLGHATSKRVDRFDPNLFKCIIIDEAHHASATTYHRLLKKIGALSDDSHILVWGCSATLRRHDGRSLDPIFQSVVYHKSFLEMIQKEYLCNLLITTVKTSVVLTDVQNVAGDFNAAQLSHRVNTPQRNQALLSTWQEKAAESRRFTLIFAVDILHIESLVALFRENGYMAHGIHSGTPPATRSSILHGFRTGQFPVLINCGILTEGVDIPQIDCIILGRPTRSGVLLQQMLGRGLRRHTCEKTGIKKQDCLVIDFADVCVDQEFGVWSTVPTLMGLRQDFDFGEDRDVAEMMERVNEISKQFPNVLDKARSLEEAEALIQQEKQRMQVQECELTLDFKEFSLMDVFSADSVTEEQNTSLYAITPLTWVRVGKYDCVLPITKKETII